MRTRVTALLAALASALLLSSLLSPAPVASALPAYRTTGTSWTNPHALAPKVVNLRYARHATFDRVVIDVRGRIPGYRTGYTAVHRYDGSGARVPIRGGLWITLTPAYAHDNSGANLYCGPRLVRPGFPALKAVAFTGDYEAHVSFAFGLDPRVTPYRIFRLHNPQRIVVDFKHSS